jgi:hypothetical protein
MHLTPVNSSVNFSGNYSGKICSLSKDSQTLIKRGVEAVNNARKYLTDLQNIDCGGFVLSNSEKVATIRPVLKSGDGEKQVVLSSFNDGFNLLVSDKSGSEVSLINVLGGDVVEFESSKYPLKSKDFKPLDGEILKTAEHIIKKYIPLFCKKNQRISP